MKSFSVGPISQLWPVELGSKTGEKSGPIGVLGAKNGEPGEWGVCWALRRAGGQAERRMFQLCQSVSENLANTGFGHCGAEQDRVFSPMSGVMPGHSNTEGSRATS
jgi:hypothetical protein